VTAPASFASITLRSDRLLLRPLREADADDLFAIFSDSRVSRYLSHPAWTDIGSAHELIARNVAAVEADKYVYLGMERVSDGRLVSLSGGQGDAEATLKWERFEIAKAGVPLKLPLVVRLGDGFPLLTEEERAQVEEDLDQEQPAH